MLKKIIAVAALSLSAFLSFAQGANQRTAISWWNVSDMGADIYRTLAAEYMDAHPEVEIEISEFKLEEFGQKLAEAMASGNPPDIFHTGGDKALAVYARAGLLRDLSEEVEGTAWGDSMGSGAWDLYRVDGKFYAIPYEMGAVTFWYNRELLENAGFSSFPSTYGELLTLIKRLKSSGATPIALGAADKWPAIHLWAYLAIRLGGPDLIARTLDGSNPNGFADRSFVEASRLLSELARNGAFQKGFLSATYPDQAGLVGDGRAAMELMGQWAPSLEKDCSSGRNGIGDKLAAAPFPVIEGGKGRSAEIIGGGSGMAFGKDAPDAAIDFIRYLSSRKNHERIARETGALVTAKGSKDAMTDWNMRAVMEMIEESSRGQTYPDSMIPYATASAALDAIYALLAGTTTPERACADIQASFLAE